MITRRRVLLAVVALFLAGVGYVAWTLAGLPPVKYYVRYGLDPYCEPTGERVTLEGIEFVEIGPGIFRMGSNIPIRSGDWPGRLSAPFGLPWGRQPIVSPREVPAHWVEFRRSYWLARTEVTNAQYRRFAGASEQPPSPGGDLDPVTVSWKAAKRFCARMSLVTNRQIRLPNEAEWECACRAGDRDESGSVNKSSSFTEHAWVRENAHGRLHAVGTRKPNAWGFYDLLGNAWELCEDLWHDTYVGAPQDGSAWMVGDPSNRVMRGQSSEIPARYLRVSVRSMVRPGMPRDDLGFRLAFTMPEPK